MLLILIFAAILWGINKLSMIQHILEDCLNILSYLNLEVMINMTCPILMRKHLMRENTNIRIQLKIKRLDYKNTHKNEL